MVRKIVASILITITPLFSFADDNPTPDYAIASMGDYVRARDLSRCVAFHAFKLAHINQDKTPLLYFLYQKTGSFYSDAVLTYFEKAGVPQNYVKDEAASKVVYFRKFYDAYYAKNGMLPPNVVNNNIDGCIGAMKVSMQLKHEAL
jgi:hypothetical protein